MDHCTCDLEEHAIGADGGWVALTCIGTAIIVSPSMYNNDILRRLVARHALDEMVGNRQHQTQLIYELLSTGRLTKFDLPC